MSRGRPIWSRPVWLICPACRVHQPAEEVTYEGDPFPSYVHECEACGYLITESEWECQGPPLRYDDANQPNDMRGYV